jgi:salicylate hydroxylase
VEIAVVGAGIGGLAAALALAGAGLAPRVLEARDLAGETGAGIQLSPNGVRVLHALGLREGLAAIGHRPEAIQLRDARSGRLIAFRPLGRSSEERYGAPYYDVHRPALFRLLRDAVTGRGIPLETGARCTGFEEHADGVRVQLATGSLDAALLVGADGIHSRVREGLLGADDARFTGNVAYRAVVPAEAVPPSLRRPLVTAWLGPARHLVHYPLGDGGDVNVVAVVERDDWREESWTAAATGEELASAFRDWHPALRELLAAVATPWKWALHDRPPLPRWSSERVTLLGDACHPMVPFLAQGACMALEDAWTLARLLEDRDEETPAAALDRYQRLRRPRTARVQREARQQGERFHERGRLKRLARDLELGLGSRLAPELAMARYDWLHGHDVVARLG